jgi:tetratricopeptide (TPR) repeat protein
MATLSGRPGKVTTILAILVLALANGRFAAADSPPKAGTDVNPEADKAVRKRALDLNNITGSDPVKGEIVALIKDASGTKILLATAVRMTKEKEQPFNVNATYILAASAHLLKDSKSAQVFYRLNLDQAVKMGSGSKINQAFGGLIELLLTDRKYAECEKACKEFLDIDGDETVDQVKPAVIRRMILAISRQDKFDKANDLLDKLIKADPTNWLNVEFKGDLLREQDKNQESAKVFEEMIEKVKDDKRLPKDAKDDFISEIQYRLSGVYIDLNEVDKAAANLKALLEKEPDNPTYNNDLGYIWADHDKNLAESEKLIRKAIDDDRKQRRKAASGGKDKDKEDEGSSELKIDSDKDNPAYLDSLGWVLFKQKKFKEAKAPLLEAIKEPEGKHIEIYDHLAEVHLALGEKSDAVAVWKKGIEAAGKTPREQQRKTEVEKKLKANQ